MDPGRGSIFPFRTPRLRPLCSLCPKESTRSVNIWLFSPARGLCLSLDLSRILPPSCPLPSVHRWNIVPHSIALVCLAYTISVRLSTVCLPATRATFRNVSKH